MQKEKYGFVYIWRDRKNNRYYIGSHWGTPDDGYICSSNWMRMAYKRRTSDFKRKIIARVYTNRADLLELEQKWLNLIKESELSKRYYNHNKNVLYNAWWMDPERAKTTRERISQALKLALQRSDVREHFLKVRKESGNKISETHKRNGHKPSKNASEKGLLLAHSEESRRKMVLTLKGRKVWNKGIPQTEEHRKKNSESKKGKKTGRAILDEVRQKMIFASIGRKHSEDHKRKIGDAIRGRIGTMLGKKHSEETKQKMRLAQSARRLKELTNGTFN